MADQTVQHDQNGEVIDSTATELVPVHHTPPPTTLFRTDDPVEVVKQASRGAEALKDVIVNRGLATKIQGRDHVRVEGWTTLGAMLGVVPVVVWSRPLSEPTKYDVTVSERNGKTFTYTVEGQDWEARVEARTLDGRVVGAAEALCSRKEKTWSQRDDYALRSMAQTRATSKALRGPLGFVMSLAGYDPTPAEEMPAAPDSQPPAATASATPRPTASKSAPTEKTATAKQRGLLNGKASEKGLSAELFANVILAAAGQDSRQFDTEDQAAQFINRQLDRLPARLVDPILEGIQNADADNALPV